MCYKRFVLNEKCLLGCHLGDLEQHQETILNKSTIIKFIFFYPKKVCIIVFNNHAGILLHYVYKNFTFSILSVTYNLWDIWLTLQK